MPKPQINKVTARPASHERGAAEGPSSRPHVKRGGVPSIGNALDNRRRHHQTEQHTVQNGYRGSEGHFRRQGRPCAGALTTSPVRPGTLRRVKGFTAVAGKMRAVDREKPVPRSTRGQTLLTTAISVHWMASHHLDHSLHQSIARIKQHGDWSKHVMVTPLMRFQMKVE